MVNRRPTSIRARQLAKELRRLRGVDGRTGEEIADALSWSGAKISRIENAITTISVPDLRRLLDAYGVSGDQRERLLYLARSVNERGWLDAYSNVTPVATMYAGLEAEASTVHSYSALVLHGLLQTEEYARQVISAGIVLPPGEIERRVQLRMRRKDRLSDKNALEYRVVLDEAAIRRRIGGSEAMREQLAHILNLMEKPNIKIQVLPFSEGAHPATFGPFVILKFPSPGNDVAYIELMDTGVYVEDEVDVHRHALAFDELRRQALTREDTIDFIRRVISEM